jgi:uncharacterized tellurite resistance protein B-like protein
VLESFKTFISNRVENSASRDQLEVAARLATAALLVRVATVDSELTDARRKRIHDILRSGFDLDEPATVQLVDEAIAAERNAIDLYQFTRQIKKALDDDARRRIVKMMWETIYVEGSLNGFEANIIWRTADLLGVSSRQRIEARQQIGADGFHPDCQPASAKT